MSFENNSLMTPLKNILILEDVLWKKQHFNVRGCFSFEKQHLTVRRWPLKNNAALVLKTVVCKKQNKKHCLCVK